MSLLEFVQRYDRPTTDNTVHAPFVFFGNTFLNRPAGDPAGNFRQFGMVVATKDVPFERGPDGTNDTFADIPALVTYIFYAPELSDWDTAARRTIERHDEIDRHRDDPLELKSWRPWTAEEAAAAKNLVLGEINIEIPSDHFDAAIAAISQKYGKPSSEHIDNLQNAMGANYTSHKSIWLMGDDTIIATERAGRVDRSLILYRRLSIYKIGQQHYEDSRRKAATDL